LNLAQTQCPKQDLTEKGESDHAAALLIANDQLRCRFARFEAWLTFLDFNAAGQRSNDGAESSSKAFETN
jgi:hypothetical protein